MKMNLLDGANRRQAERALLRSARAAKQVAYLPDRSDGGINLEGIDYRTITIEVAGEPEEFDHKYADSDFVCPLVEVQLCGHYAAPILVNAYSVMDYLRRSCFGSASLAVASLLSFDLKELNWWTIKDNSGYSWHLMSFEPRNPPLDDNEVRRHFEHWKKRHNQSFKMWNKMVYELSDDRSLMDDMRWRGHYQFFSLHKDETRDRATYWSECIENIERRSNAIIKQEDSQ